MKNFVYDGQYPGYVNGEWIIDERDGHVWLNIPGSTVLENFPGEYSLHFMETPKEYGNPNINLRDEIFNIPSFKFDKILQRNKPVTGSRDFYETLIGNEIELSLAEHIPPGVTIGSIILKDKTSGKLVNVINLRTMLVFDILRKVKLKFAVSVRIADYGLTVANNVSLGNNRTVSFETYYVEVPITDWENKKTFYSSPEDYATFNANQVNSEGWFVNHHQLAHYTEDMLKGPQGLHKVNNGGTSKIQLTGTFELIRGFTGIKAITVPFCPGISFVIRFNEFNDKGTKTPYLNLITEKYINFNFFTRFNEVSR